MNQIFGMISYILLATTIESVIFSGGIGLSRVFRAANRPKLLKHYAVLLTVFTFISAILTTLFGAKIWSLFPPVIFAFCTAAVYLLAVFILRFWFHDMMKKVEPVLAPAAMNCVVFSIPFVSSFLKLNLLNTIGFALGTGLSFFLAAMILQEASKNFQDPNMPKAFRGLPARFLYIGILSMAFFGFNGGRLF